MILLTYFGISKKVVSLWPFCFIALWMTMLTLYGQATLDNFIINATLSPTKNKLGFKASFKLDMIIKEELIELDYDNHLVIRTTLDPTNKKNNKLLQAFQVRKKLDDALNYCYLPNETEVHSKVTTSALAHEGKHSPRAHKTSVRRYFEVIRSPSGHCNKLVRIGGRFYCDSSLGDEDGRDGHKFICFDREFRFGSKNDLSCLVLSFGVHTDTTFDEGIADMNCDVHMFDIVNYENEDFREDKHLVFHQIGLDLQRYRNINPITNVSMDFDTLDHIIIDLGVQNRLINILKLDIEGREWPVLQDLSSKPYLDAIGQIAVEVHALELASLSNEERRKKVEYWISIIEALESRGFRRVAYWDNNQPGTVFTDLDGTEFQYFGELTLINSNWFNQTFMEALSEKGYNLV